MKVTFGNLFAEVWEREATVSTGNDGFRACALSFRWTNVVLWKLRWLRPRCPVGMQLQLRQFLQHLTSAIVCRRLPSFPRRKQAFSHTNSAMPQMGRISHTRTSSERIYSKQHHQRTADWSMRRGWLSLAMLMRVNMRTNAAKCGGNFDDTNQKYFWILG
jgi:hypothetical protein